MINVIETTTRGDRKVVRYNGSYLDHSPYVVSRIVDEVYNYGGRRLDEGLQRKII